MKIVLLALMIMITGSCFAQSVKKVPITKKDSVTQKITKTTPDSKSINKDSASKVILLFADSIRANTPLKEFLDFCHKTITEEKNDEIRKIVGQLILKKYYEFIDRKSVKQ